MFDQQPLVSLAARTARAHVRQHEVTFQLLALQAKLQIAFGKHLARIPERLPSASVPDHHRAGTIVSRRDQAFEVEVRDRMIFDHHGEPLVSRIERWALRHRP